MPKRAASAATVPTRAKIVKILDLLVGLGWVVVVAYMLLLG